MRSAGTSILAAGLLWAVGCGSEPAIMDRGPTTVAPPVVLPTAGTSATPMTTTPPPVSRPNQPPAVTTPPVSMTPAPPTPAPPVTNRPPMTTPPPPMTPVPPGMVPPPPPGPAEPAPAGAMEPQVPMITGDCPPFRDATITYMSLPGIIISAGAKPSGKTGPMVFYWHGTGTFAGEFSLMAAAIASGVKAEGGVLVSFDGTTGGDLLSGTFIFGAGDFKIADQLFACAVRDHNVDPRRVFATGCSAGGLFSGAMAASRSSYMAAAAPNSGGWTIPVPFQNKNTPALMTVHGAPGLDVVVIDFSDSSKTADSGFKAAGGFVINCNHGGGHCGGAGLAGDMWKFFKAHPFGTKPSPWAGGLPAGFNSSCKIF